MGKRYLSHRVAFNLVLMLMLLLIQEVKGTVPETILVGTEHNYPPYSFQNDKGEPTGFNVALTKAVADAMGLTVRIDYRPWAELRSDLEAGKINAISGMFYSPERDKHVDFSSPYAVISHTVFVRDGSPEIAAEEDLHDREIIVMKGDIMHDYVLEKNISEKLFLAKDPAEALQRLSSGQHDCVLMAKIPGLYWVRELKLSNIKTGDLSLQPFKYCFAVRQDDSQLLFLLNEGLAVIRETGQYRQIYNEWLGSLETRTFSFGEVIEYTAMVLVPLLLILCLSLLWTRSLKGAVNRKTEELERELDERKRIQNALKTALDVSRTREQEIAALLSGAQAVLEQDDFSETARKIFDACRGLIGAASGYVALLSDDGAENELLFLEAGGLPCSVDPDLPMPIRGLRSEAYKTNKPVYHNDFMKSQWIEFMPKGHVILKNVMFAPLVLKGKTVGIIGLANKSRDFNDNDAKMSAAFGELAAIALSNSRNLEERVKAENHREIVIRDLEKALSQVKMLSGLLPICSHCKKIRDDQGYWNQIEVYIQKHSEALFSHGICRDCAKILYPDIDLYDD